MIRAGLRILAAALLALAPAGGVTGAGADQGAALYDRCKRCHQVGSGARHRIGPHLNGIFGRGAGSMEDYRYSSAMKAAGREGLVWTEETLDAFLADPRGTVPRTRMSVAGMTSGEDRAVLLEWLRGFSEDGGGLPAAERTSTPEEYGLDPRILEIAGDPDYGAYLSSQCTTCHSASGGERGIPSISHWPTDDFVIAMHAYKHGKREHPVMQLVARQLSDEEIASLAAHFLAAGHEP